MQTESKLHLKYKNNFQLFKIFPSAQPMNSQKHVGLGGSGFSVSVHHSSVQVRDLSIPVQFRSVRFSIFFSRFSWFQFDPQSYLLSFRFNSVRFQNLFCPSSAKFSLIPKLFFPVKLNSVWFQNFYVPVQLNSVRFQNFCVPVQFNSVWF